MERFGFLDVNNNRLMVFSLPDLTSSELPDLNGSEALSEPPELENPFDNN